MFLECCSMDKPWNVVPQEPEHRGKLCLITHICVLLLCVIIHGFFFTVCVFTSQLAHEAFKIAQSLEPLYVNCWIGQVERTCRRHGASGYDVQFPEAFT